MQHQYFKNTLQFLILLGILFMGTKVKALHPDNETSLYNHMTEVNVQWENYQEYCPQGTAHFISDLDRIQMHLRLVHQYLVEHTKTTLTQQQLENRNTLLEALSGYADRKVFPTNHYHNVRRPYFVDDFGIHCAVGYLIKVSGHTDLVAKVRKDFNYDYIEDIKVPEIKKWAEDYGFTVEELKWIQPGYAPNTTMEPLSGGTNGPVHVMSVDNTNNRLLFAGDFTEVDDSPCSNIGKYENNQLSCLGNGLSGIVHAVYGNTSGVYAIGAFEDNGITYPIARFENGNWSYIGIPGRSGAEATTAFGNVAAQSFELAISHPSFTGQEIWFGDPNGTWTKKAEVNGVVKTIEASGWGRVFAGSFDTLKAFVSGTLDTTFSTQNVAFKGNMVDLWFGISDSAICDTVLSVEVVGNSIYFAGSCSEEPNRSDVCLSRYQNELLQPLLLKNSFVNNSVAIEDIAFDMNNSLILGGRFDISGFSNGKNLARYDLVYNTMYVLGVMDQSVKEIERLNNKVYLGGVFTQGFNSPGLNHLARVTSFASIQETTEGDDLVVYPNPTDDILTISAKEKFTQYQVIDMQGKVIKTGNLSSGNVINLEHLQSGQYVVLLQTQEGSLIREKIVKR